MAVADEGDAAGSAVAHARSARRGRVLIIDDEPGIGTTLRLLLVDEHDVVTTTRARHARDLIAGGERFDVILCDLMMPEMSGVELHAELSTIAPESAARMVFLTGGAYTDTARAFLARVDNRRVEKPFDATTLHAMVRSLVG